MLVSPTQKWLQGPDRIPAGSLGMTVRPTRQGVVPDKIGQWLIENGYATRSGGSTTASRTSPDMLPDPSPDPGSPQSPQAELTDSTSTEAVQTEPAEPIDTMLEFFRSASAGQIAKRINGIGPKTAGEILDARSQSPLTLENLREILSQSQLETAAAAFEVQLPDEDAT